MKFYVIAGEASGDMHGANLLEQINLLIPNSNIRAWGGDLMAAQGATIVKHYRDLAFMGFAEVIANLRTILRNIEHCKSDITQFQPQCIILIDYPGFNLRIAEFAAQRGIKVVYYISPQIWAWKKSRVHKIKRYVHLMLTILPFEKKFYDQYNYNVTYVGHPLLDAIKKYIATDVGIIGEPYIALLPGSRKQEISTMLPLMLGTVSHFKNYKIIIAAAPSIDEKYYRELIGRHEAILVKNKTYQILQHAHAALVTSGTATLETALFNVPQVVCYKGNWLSIQIARMLVNIPYISLVNLIADKKVVTELIQSDLNEQNMVHELQLLLKGETRQHMLADYKQLHNLLGNEGASLRAAQAIYQLVLPIINEQQ